MASFNTVDAVKAFLSDLKNQVSVSMDKLPPDFQRPVAITLSAILITLIVNYLLTPSIDPREPPLLKPRIPLVGHILGLFRHQAGYHNQLHRENPNTPIATLQMLNGKMYAIWDPTLVSSGLRNKYLAVGPHIKAMTPLLADTSPATTAKIRADDTGDYMVDQMFNHAIPKSLKGPNLNSMTEVALDNISQFMNTFAAPLPQQKQHQPAASSSSFTEIPNTWLWIRNLVTLATSPALYGSASSSSSSSSSHFDPFAADPSLEQTLWDFLNDLLPLTTGFLPSVFAPVGVRGRSRLADALKPYYSQKHDQHETASAFVRLRGSVLRGVGVPDDDIARLETMLPFAAMANTVPTLFWFFSRVVSRRDLVEQLREEVERGLVVSRGKGEVTLMAGAAGIEEKCPLLWGCYKETLRTTVHQISTRTVVQDTTVSDGVGRQYLLKKDCVVQMSLGVSLASGEYWGQDVDEFSPERWTDAAARKIKDGEPGSVKMQRAAYQPFGGGLHLCPGRYFAVAEMMAIMATMILGFDVEPLDGEEWKLPGRDVPSLVDAVTKPAEEGKGFGLRIRRREGWEKVKWKYVL